MRPIFMPARAKARRALCAPGPGVLVLLPPVARSLMCSAVMPSSCEAHARQTKGCFAHSVLKSAGVHEHESWHVELRQVYAVQQLQQDALLTARGGLLANVQQQIQCGRYG
eukprot:GHUV01054552.1.p1 GENE.GHUV01054552.1~~GHUV01054552.1.p1  ORF type:complete len:111 (+),score=27.75 GHUV01054552.1:154-486(+)